MLYIPNKRILFFLYFCSISLLISTHCSEVFIVLSSCLISIVIPSAERRNRSVNCTVLYFSDTVIISPDKNRQLKRFDFLMSSLYCNSYLQYFYVIVLIVIGLVSSDQNCIQSLKKQRKNPGSLVKSRNAYRRHANNSGDTSKVLLSKHCNCSVQPVDCNPNTVWKQFPMGVCY